MSYIRATSNPESLYVFGSITGNVEWYAGKGCHPDLVMPGKTFDELMRALDRGWGDYDVEYAGAKVIEPHPDTEGMSGVQIIKAFKDFDIRLIVSYGGKEIRMYQVTLEHILENWRKRRIRSQFSDLWWVLTARIPWWIRRPWWVITKRG